MNPTTRFRSFRTRYLTITLALFLVLVGSIIHLVERLISRSPSVTGFVLPWGIIVLVLGWLTLRHAVMLFRPRYGMSFSLGLGAELRLALSPEARTQLWLNQWKTGVRALAVTRGINPFGYVTVFGLTETKNIFYCRVGLFLEPLEEPTVIDKGDLLHVSIRWTRAVPILGQFIVRTVHGNVFEFKVSVFQRARVDAIQRGTGDVVPA